MRAYYVDTSWKLLEIFMKHCSLSLEQFDEISLRLLDLVTEVQETDEGGCGSFDEVERKANELFVIFKFLLNTKEITLEEYNNVCNLVNGIANDARAMREAEE